MTLRRDGLLTCVVAVLAMAALASAATKTKKKKPSPSPSAAAPTPAADPSADAARAQGLVAEKRYAEAEVAARSALAQDPTHDVAVAALGQALVAQK